MHEDPGALSEQEEPTLTLGEGFKKYRSLPLVSQCENDTNVVLSRGRLSLQ
jgi:hypothetical protein